MGEVELDGLPFWSQASSSDAINQFFEPEP